MSQLFEPLQDAIVQTISALDDFALVPVVAFKAGDLQSTIEQQVKRAQGICALVMPPFPTRVAACPHMVFEHVKASISLVSHMHHNTAIPSLLTLAESLSHNLHQWSPALNNWHGKLQLETQEPWSVHLAKRAPEPHRIDIHFHIFGKLNAS